MIFCCLQTAKIKEQLEEKEGIPPAQQRLIYMGKAMYVTLLPRPRPPHSLAVHARVARLARLPACSPACSPAEANLYSC